MQGLHRITPIPAIAEPVQWWRQAAEDWGTDRNLSPENVPEGVEVMGFAFEDETGLPVIVGPSGTGRWKTPPPLTLHVEPGPTPSPEVAIGDIMLKVQRFADETAEEARRRPRSVVAGAQVEAASIVARARRQAEEISVPVAPSLAPEAVAKLCSAIDEFADTNRILVDELVQLRRALAGGYGDTPVSPSLSAVPPVAG